MADQVQGMARAGISAAVTVDGQLSMPERQDALDKVRIGDAAMLLVARAVAQQVGPCGPEAARDRAMGPG